MMLLSAPLLALAATAQTVDPQPSVTVRAQTQVLVQIIQAAEVRDGQTSSPHQRTVRTDEAGQTQILLQFE
ncbi:hypothetical protein [Sphingomonas sp. LHG3443-2]|uniref:hypothetical protein n=1 Tax=Sphingomonas sp. LHG3443-2 TaxID=2804639 RepID=UPI003CEAB963